MYLNKTYETFIYSLYLPVVMKFRTTHKKQFDLVLRKFNNESDKIESMRTVLRIYDEEQKTVDEVADYLKKKLGVE